MNKTMKWIALAGLSVITSVSFVGCVKMPKTIGEGMEKMYEAGYEVEGWYGEEDYNCIGVIEGWNENTEEWIEAILYANEKAAEKYFYYYGENLKQGLEYGEVCKQEGAWIIRGTSMAVDTFME